MRKFLTIVLVAVVACFVGFKIGVRHVAADAEIWLNEYVQPAEGDWLIHVTVDGETYEQVLWIY